MTTQSTRPLTPSAVRVLDSLAKSKATYQELLIRMRPMSERGLTAAVYELQGRKLAYLAEDGYARLTAAGWEAVAS